MSVRIFYNITKIEHTSLRIGILNKYSTEITTAKIHPTQLFNKNFNTDQPIEERLVSKLQYKSFKQLVLVSRLFLAALKRSTDTD